MQPKTKAERAPGVAVHDSPSVLPATPSRRVLLAKDNEVNNYIFTAMLAGEDLAIDLAPNGLAALEMLRILEPYDLKAMGHNSAPYLHHLVEAKKLAYADLDRFVADADHLDMPSAEMLTDAFIAERRSHLNASRAQERVEPGPMRTASETIYLTTADAEGNMVSLINSNYDAFGSGIVVPGTGFALHNRGAAFTLAPGMPNTAAPGKRPFHTLIPGFVTHTVNGREQAYMSFGLMGGGVQAQGHVQFLLNHFVFGMDVQAAIDAGLDVDDFAPRLSFFWNGHNNFFEEIAKFRASRRMWHTIMTERFDAQDPKSAMLRFHTQTGGSTLTAQQPMNNIMRVTLQAMASVLGGTQSLHTNGYDEALSLPTEEAARMALRTQQVIGYESGVADTPDPLAGSYFVESLTDEVERLAWEYIERIDEMGGAVAAIESGFQMDEIEQAAYEYTKSIDDDERVIVGVNKFKMDNEPAPKVIPVDPDLEGNQVARLTRYKANRDTAAVESTLAKVKATAEGSDNLLYSMKDALRADATLGEISDALREVFGIHTP